MKKLILLFALVLFASSSAYSLPNFWYSAVAYNSLGQIITAPTFVEVNITINDGSTIFTENFLGGAAVGTDPFGVFSVHIGTGTNSGNLSSVLMKSNTSINVKVRPVSTTLWVTVIGSSLVQEYYKTNLTLILGGSNYWSLSGNAGTTPGVNFIGTTDNKDLVFKVNNLEYGRLTSTLDNVSIGRGALTGSPTGGANSAYGHNALQINSTGHSNSGFGYGTLTNNTTGIYNTALGSWALYGNLSGSHNTAVGSEALYDWFSSTGITTGNDNTALGYNANVIAGNLNNVIVIGANAIATASNQVRLGDNNITSLYSMGATAAIGQPSNMYVDAATGQIMRSTIATITGAANVGAGTGLIFRNQTGNTLNFKSIAAGTHMVVTNNPNDITLSTDATNLNTPSTIVSRDASGNFSAGTITAGSLIGPLTGNASTATALQTARNFSITGPDVTAAAVSFNGTANVVLTSVLTPTGVIAGTYGSATAVPKFSVDANGRLTAAADVAIAIPPSQITPGGTDDMIKMIGGIPTWTPITGDVNIFGPGTTQIQNTAGNSIVAAINNVATSNRITLDRLVDGSPNQFLIRNGSGNVWAGLNRDATLLGDGIGTALGIDLSHANTWSGAQTFGTATVTGNLDVQGYIMNSVGANAVYINDYLQISNTISNPTLQNGGKIYVGDDFEVTGTTTLGGAVQINNTLNVTGLSTLATVDINGGNIDGTIIGATTPAAGTFTSVKINGALNDGSSDGTANQIPIADGAGNWAWSNISGSFAIATDGHSIVGDGTTGNPIRMNSGIISSSTPSFDLNSDYVVFEYTGNNDNLTVLNPVKGRVIWIMKTAGTGNLSFAGVNIGTGTSASFIYSGTTWIHVQ